MAATLIGVNSSVVDYRNKFDDLSSKFSCLAQRRTEGDRQFINKILDELNALDYKSPIVYNVDKAVLMINHCCTIVPSNDTFLVAKGCQLISNLVTKQFVKVEGKTLSLSINWCIQSLKYCADIAMIDILSALEALLKGNGNKIEEKQLLSSSALVTNNMKDIIYCCRDSNIWFPYEQNSEQMHELLGTNGILPSLMQYTDASKGEKEGIALASPQDINLSVVKCLESLTEIQGDAPNEEYLKQPHLDRCAKLLLQQLYKTESWDKEQRTQHKILISALRGLQNIFQNSPNELVQLLGDGLGVVKCYMLYGLPGYSDLIPHKVFPTNLNQCEIRHSVARDGRGAKNVRARKNRNTKLSKFDSMNEKKNEDDHFTLANHKPVEQNFVPSWIKTSDSEFSDTETGQATRMHSSESRVRREALKLLFVIKKVCDRRTLFGYWCSLLSDAPNVPSLTTCILKDSSAHNRILALDVLSSLLFGSRLYLSQAEESSRNSVSFTPFSVTLGNMICELHHALCSALSSENYFPVLIQLLKCTAVLVQNTPYHRVQSDLISEVVCNVKGFLKHKDSNIQVAALTVLGCIVSVEPTTAEVKQVLHKCPQKQEAESCDEEPEISHSKMSWLLEICIQNINMPLLQVPVRVESLQVISALVKYFLLPIVSEHLDILVPLLEKCLGDCDSNISFHAGKVIYALGTAMQELDSTEVFTLDKMLQFWEKILSGSLIAIIQNTKHGSLRAVSCECLASVRADVFELLPKHTQLLVTSSLFGCCTDEESTVRSSAIRGIAISILFPILREDIHFICDTAESVIRAMKDNSPLVREKASWALGNLTDSLVINHSEERLIDIPETHLIKLLETGIKASHDNDKVQSNAVRAVGNLLRLATKELLTTNKFKKIVEQAIAALIHNATTCRNMKVRWNACYAIGNMMRNNSLFSENMTWQASVFHALTQLVQNVQNFKVRISAASALSVPFCREYYGAYYNGCWTALLNGLENSQNMEDFTEYKHQNHLIDQLCESLLHLVKLIIVDDLASLHDILMFHIDTLQHHMARYQERVLPEHAGTLNEAMNHALMLLQQPHLSSNQHSAAATLSSILLQDMDHSTHFS